MDIPEDPDNIAITSAVISLSHSLGLNVIAEGVETETQMEYLRRQGCDMAQGYYFSKPVPPDDFLRNMQTISLNCKKDRVEWYI